MTLIIDLPPSVEANLADAAKPDGVLLEDFVLRKLEEIPASEPGRQGTTPPDYLADLAARFKASMPEEEWNRLPADYATNFKACQRADVLA
jgi:hypothetical protein